MISVSVPLESPLCRPDPRTSTTASLVGFGRSIVRPSLPRPQLMRSSGRGGIFLGKSCRGFIGFSLIVGPTRRWRFASLGAGFFRISVDGVDCAGAGSVLLLLLLLAPGLRGRGLPVVFMYTSLAASA